MFHLIQLCSRLRKKKTAVSTTTLHLLFIYSLKDFLNEFLNSEMEEHYKITLQPVTSINCLFCSSYRLKLNSPVTVHKY